MKKLQLRNIKLFKIWGSLFVLFLLLTIAMNTGLLARSYPTLAITFGILVLSVIFLYQWTVANRIMYTDQDLSLRDWSQGLFFSGIRGNTVESKIPLQDIKEFWIARIADLRSQATQTNDFQLSNQLKYPPDKEPAAMEKLPVINVVYKDGRIHLSNTTNFSQSRLDKVAELLAKKGIRIRRF